MNQEQRIEYFMSEIARLSNQVVDLQDERDALMAQLTMVRKIFRDESLSASETLRKIPFVIDLAPEQCIANLRAEAGRDGYLKGADDWKSFDQVFDLDINRAADEYAESILNGE